MTERFAILALLIALLSRSVAAQGDHESIAIIAAALGRERSNLPPALAIDPRILRAGPFHPTSSSSEGWLGERPAPQMAALVGELGAVVAKRENVRQCEQTGRRRCRLIGIDGHLTFSAPVVLGDSATVELFAEANSTNDVFGTGAIHVRYTLSKERGTWKVVKRTILGAT